MNAFIKAKPSDVARKSLTYKSESAIFTAAPDWPGALSKKKGTGTCRIWDMCCSRLAPMRLAPFSYFLNLLERQSKRVRKVCLAHFEHQAPHPHAAADMPVDGI